MMCGHTIINHRIILFLSLNLIMKKILLSHMNFWRMIIGKMLKTFWHIKVNYYSLSKKWPQEYAISDLTVFLVANFSLIKIQIVLIQYKSSSTPLLLQEKPFILISQQGFSPQISPNSQITNLTNMRKLILLKPLLCIKITWENLSQDITHISCDT